MAARLDALILCDSAQVRDGLHFGALHETPRPMGLQADEGRQVPAVVPLHKLKFAAPGHYDLQVDIDDEFAGDLSFRGEPRPTGS